METASLLSAFRDPTGALGGYALTKLVFQRGLALVYLIGFVAAAHQFKALLGEKGLLPVRLFVKQVRFSEAPSLFHLFPKDAAFTALAWIGIALSIAALLGITERYGTAVSMTAWALLYVLYLSFVNVGQTFYGFGWESMLLEAGFFAVFLGDARLGASGLLIIVYRWLLFRVMFGAGLIKLRGDECWKDLTCLFYHYETQPMPNPLSWFAHWMPQWFHRAGVAFNHFVELVVPFFYFAPQPIAAIAGLITVIFHGILIATGNFAFLSLLTIVLAIPTFDDKFLSMVLRVQAPTTAALSPWHGVAVVIVGVLAAVLSLNPLRNLLSPRQAMNASYNPYHIVGSYGAFGSITRPRYEVIVEGTTDAVITDSTVWKEYEFIGKPGDLRRRPPQVAPYHLRLDWLMWFAGFSPYYQHPWFVHMVAKFLQNDPQTLALIRANPFPDAPPTYVRAQLYEYRFTSPEERKRTGAWWRREFVMPYFPPVSLHDQKFLEVLRTQGWVDAKTAP